MKHLLIDGMFGCGNFGDDLMLLCVLDHLESIGTPIMLHVRLRDLKGESSVILRDRQYLSIRPFFGKLAYVNRLVRCRQMLWVGGTFLYEGGGQGVKGIVSIMGEWLLARVFFCRIIVVGIGFGPFLSNAGNLLSKMALRLTRFVTLRDRRSYEDVVSFLGSEKVCHADDLALTIAEYRIYPAASSASNDSVSHVIFSGYFFQSPVSLGKSLELLKSVVRLLNSQKRPVHIHLVSFLERDKIRDDGRIFSKEICEKIRSFCSHLHIHKHLSFSEKVFLIKNADVVIGARLHVILMACLLRKQVFPIIYHEKVQKFLSEIDYHGPFVDDLNGKAVLEGHSTYSDELLKGKKERGRANLDIVDKLLGC